MFSLLFSTLQKYGHIIYTLNMENRYGKIKKLKNNI